MNYRSRAYVDLHVIDAIDEERLKTGESEALMLRYFLRGTDIHIISHLAWDINSLDRVIDEIANYRRQYCNPRRAIPFLHVSCHGTKDGLLLGDSPLLQWSRLSECLLPLQRKTDYNLPLSLSSCWGYYGAKLASEIDSKYAKQRPYYSLVGPKHEEGIVTLCNAFGVFYSNLLGRFRSLKESVKTANKNGSVELDYTYGSKVV